MTRIGFLSKAEDQEKNVRHLEDLLKVSGGCWGLGGGGWGQGAGFPKKVGGWWVGEGGMMGFLDMKDEEWSKAIPACSACCGSTGRILRPDFGGLFP